MILKNVMVEVVYDNIIYDELMKVILNFTDKDFFSLIHFHKEDGEIYIPKVDENLCSDKAPKYLSQPNVKIFYEEKQLDSMDEISLLVNININRLDDSENFKVILYGDMEYYDVENQNREFSLLE